MGDVVNLRQARKQKARADKARTAEGNRARFGRTKAERATLEAETASRTRMLEGHRRENDTIKDKKDLDDC